jgi:hypothetical protein
MARLVLPPKLELKRPDGSSNAAPLANVNLTAFLSVVIPRRDAPPLPLLDHVGIGLFDQLPDLSERLAPPIT